MSCSKAAPHGRGFRTATTGPGWTGKPWLVYALGYLEGGKRPPTEAAFISQLSLVSCRGICNSAARSLRSFLRNSISWRSNFHHFLFNRPHEAVARRHGYLSVCHDAEAEMHPAAKFQFERTAREFSQWRAIPEQDRSPAPAWWWQPAIDVVAQDEEMGALLCYRLQLPVSSTYAAGAAVLMPTLAGQTSLPWPDAFPRKIHRQSA